MINDYEARHDITDPNFKSTERNVMTNDEVISTLNNLIETCRDGQEGFTQSAEGVENSRLKTIFFEYAQQRAKFANELQSLVRELGGKPETSASTAGAIHRGWINLKSALTGRDEKAILNECERGEDSAKENYKDAVKSNLPAHVMSVVQDQYLAVQSAHDQIRALRDSMDNTARSTARP